MSKEVQNSIEELVNSSLDIAAEEMMEDADTAVDSELEAIEDDGLAEPEELDLDMVKGDEDIDVQIEPDSELEDKIDSVLDEATELEEVVEAESLDKLGSEAIDDEAVDTEIDVMPTEEVAETDQGDSVPVESIEALENEVSELETEIQTQMDSLVVKADHLKNSIQSEIQRVSDKNEELQIQVTQLEKQLLESEGKVEALVEVQDRQQETIKKLIRILKGVNTKITHLYDSKD